VQRLVLNGMPLVDALSILNKRKDPQKSLVDFAANLLHSTVSQLVSRLESFGEGDVDRELEASSQSDSFLAKSLTLQTITPPQAYAALLRFLSSLSSSLSQSTTFKNDLRTLCLIRH
jgi:hypothetical protein